MLLQSCSAIKELVFLWVQLLCTFIAGDIIQCSIGIDVAKYQYKALTCEFQNPICSLEQSAHQIKMK